MIKIVDWNINGGYLIKNGETKNDFNYFIKKIEKLNPDIVFIQEGHHSNIFSQAEELSKKLKLKYYKIQELGESHIEKGNQLCLFILSKYEIINSDFIELMNPNLVSYHEKYGEIRSDIFKKGFLKTEMIISGEKVSVICGHAHALHIFNKNFDDFPELIKETKEYIIEESKKGKLIFGADLNYGNVSKTFNNVFENGVKLVFSNVITHVDFQSDYILLSKNYNVLRKKLDFCTDDHALLYVEVEDKGV